MAVRLSCKLLDGYGGTGGGGEQLAAVSGVSCQSKEGCRGYWGDMVAGGKRV